MEAANLLKRQEASRKESMELSGSKPVDNVDSPSYDAELNAATASIISLPAETSSPIISNHGDVRFTVVENFSEEFQATENFQSDSPTNSQLYQFHEVLPLNHQTDELRRTAGEILNGVRRNVEVQIMHPNELQSYSILNSGECCHIKQCIVVLNFIFFNRRLPESNIEGRNHAGKWSRSTIR